MGGVAGTAYLVGIDLLAPCVVHMQLLRHCRHGPRSCMRVDRIPKENVPYRARASTCHPAHPDGAHVPVPLNVVSWAIGTASGANTTAIAGRCVVPGTHTVSRCLRVRRAARSAVTRSFPMALTSVSKRAYPSDTPHRRRQTHHRRNGCVRSRCHHPRRVVYLQDHT